MELNKRVNLLIEDDDPCHKRNCKIYTYVFCVGVKLKPKNCTLNRLKQRNRPPSGTIQFFSSRLMIENITFDYYNVRFKNTDDIKKGHRYKEWAAGYGAAFDYKAYIFDKNKKRSKNETC